MFATGSEIVKEQSTFSVALLYIKNPAPAVELEWHLNEGPVVTTIFVKYHVKGNPKRK